MDICTRDAKRGQYASLCVQVPIDQLLLTSLYIGNFHKQIQYEGISLLYYSCGRIGHKPSACPQQLSIHQSTSLHATSNTSKFSFQIPSPTIVNVTTPH